MIASLIFLIFCEKPLVHRTKGLKIFQSLLIDFSSASHPKRNRTFVQRFQRLLIVCRVTDVSWTPQQYKINDILISYFTFQGKWLFRTDKCWKGWGKFLWKAQEKNLIRFIHMFCQFATFRTEKSNKGKFVNIYLCFFFSFAYILQITRTYVCYSMSKHFLLFGDSFWSEMETYENHLRQW